MGSPSGHSYYYIADNTAQKAAAEQAQKLWSRYNEKYLPVVHGLIGELGDHPEELDAAVTRSNQKSDQSAEGLMNTMALYGMQLNPIQRQALMTKLNANKTLDAITARTNQRREINDRNDALTQSLVGEGAGIRGLSSDAVNSAASLEEQRNSTGYGLAGARTQRSQSAAQNKVNTAVGAGTTALNAATMALALS